MLALFSVGVGLALLLILPTSYTPWDRQGQQLQFSVWLKGQRIGEQKEQLTQMPDGQWRLTTELAIHTVVREQAIRIVERSDLWFAKDRPYALTKVAWSKTDDTQTQTLTANRVGDRFEGFAQSDGARRAITSTTSAFSLVDYLSLSSFVVGRRGTGQSMENVHWKRLTFPALVIEERAFKVVAKGSRWTGKPWVFSAQGERTMSDVEIVLASNGAPLAMQYGRNWKVTALNAENLHSGKVMQEDAYAQGSIKTDRALGAARLVHALSLRYPQQYTMPLSNTTRQYSVPGFVLVDNSLPFEVANQEDIASSLKSERRFSPHSKHLHNTTAQLLHGVTMDAEKVDRLLLFVSEHLSHAPIFQEQDAAHIFKDRRGDCTEFAQLFVAMARAAHIPAREVSGWVYLGDDAQRFGGHAWAEVVIDGRWVAVDPMWNLRPVSAAHLRAGSGDTAAWAVAQAPGGFEFSVERVSYQ